MSKIKYVLGIDGSLSVTGLAIIDRKTEELLLATKVSTTKAKFPILEQRIHWIGASILRFMASFYPNLSSYYCGLENGFIGKSKGDGLNLGTMRGCCIGMIKMSGSEIQMFEPKAIRSKLSKGDMDKEEVYDYIIQKYGLDHPVIQAIGPYSDKNNSHKTSDIYDAIGIAIATKRSLDEKECQENEINQS